MSVKVRANTSNKIYKNSTGNKKVIDKKNKPELKIILLLLLISIITFISFYPALNNDFTNWDDNVYITENTFVNDLKADNLKQIFSTPVSLNYHPLTMLSLAIDHKIAFNKETKIVSPRPFHTTNLVIHIINTLLVFYLIFLLSGRNISVAFIVSIFFGIHPLRVESVAWISERKDVLYCFFYILSLIAYLKFIETKMLRLYFLVFILFLCSLLSKGMAMTLPLILLITDYYKNRKMTKTVILEKIPFFILSVIFGVIALNIQSKGALGDFTAFNIFQRFLIASYGLCMYVYKFLLPFNLSSFYPYPFVFIKELVKFPLIFYFCPVILLLAAGLLLYSKKFTNVFIFGSLFYFFSISIVLQFVSVGIVIIADRYTYIPFIGLFYIIAVLYNHLEERSSDNRASNHSLYNNLKYLYATLLISFGIICSYTTYHRTKIWKNSQTLWTDVINKYPEKVETSYLNRGNYFARELSDKNPAYLDSAMEDYQVLMKMNKANPSVYSTMGNVYAIKGDLEKSIESYNNSILLDSTDYKTYINRALTFIKLKKYDLSLNDIEKVLTIYRGRQPYVLQAYDNLMLGNYEKAISLYNVLINNYADYYDGYFYRGSAYMKLQQYEKALFDFNYYLKFNNKNTDVYYYMSSIYYNMSRYEKAFEFALKAKNGGYLIDENYMLQIEGKINKKNIP